MLKKETANYYKHFGVELYDGTLHKHEFPVHFHEAYTIIIIVEGEMDYHFSDNSIRVRKGEILIINPFDSHYNRPGELSCVYKTIFLPVHYFAIDDALLFFPRQTIKNSNCFGYLINCFQLIKRITDEISIENIIEDIRDILIKEIPPVIDRLTYNARVVPAVKYINAHLDDKLLIKDLARICLISRSHFQRLFKNTIGLTVQAYIQQQRTEYGKQTIREGNSATQATYDTGYFDQGHFHKAFKKMWVANPSHFSK